MHKAIVFAGIILFFATTLCLAEELTITTYYPSPFGVYNELQTNKLAVGDTNDDGRLTDADQPSMDGNIRLRPQTGDPANWSAGEEGEIAYSSTEAVFYYYDGSSWVRQGGEGGGWVEITNTSTSFQQGCEYMAVDAGNTLTRYASVVGPTRLWFAGSDWNDSYCMYSSNKSRVIYRCSGGANTVRTYERCMGY